MSNLLGKRDYFKPFKYPWAYEHYKRHQSMAWIPEEISLAEDTLDWAKKLTEADRNLLTQIFRLFTQMDVCVGGCYYNDYLPLLSGHPEVALMLGDFANREGVHQDSYSLLIESVGMPETQYQVFQEYEEMADKVEFLAKDRHILEAIIAKSVFGEGLQLFASFAILFSYPRRGLMKGMGKVVEWSIRDETAHVEGMVQLWHTLAQESGVDKNILGTAAYEICKKAVECEDAFVDLAFEQGDVEGITAEEVKGYIRYIANMRMKQLDFAPVFDQDTNPIPWIDEMQRLPAHTNFFEGRSTEYTKGALTGDFKDAYS